MSRVRTALVVDDNEQLAMLVARVLPLEGFEVRTATRGLHGHSAYFREPTASVVTDIQMPELEGVEMMRCIRSINPHVRTLYTSPARIEHQASLDRERQEFDAKVLAQPFSKSLLLVRERVGQLLHESPKKGKGISRKFDNASSSRKGSAFDGV